MNKSYFPDIITKDCNNPTYWKDVIRKISESFF